MIDPRRLLIFREVARQRSFSRAAQALSLTQPAVSQQIRALETTVGGRLIERGRGGFALTEAGQLLLEHSEPLWERLRLAEAQLGEALAGARRSLRLGAFPSALATIVPTAIAEVQASVDGLEVSAVQGTAAELVEGVRDGSLHLGLCFQDAAEPRRQHEGVAREDLFDEPMVVALGPRHRLAGRSRIRLAELTDDTWLAAVRGGLIHQACVRAGFGPRLAYFTDDPLAIRALVAAGLAVTLAPRLLAGMLDGIATAAVAGEPVRRSVYAVTPTTGVHPLAGPLLAALSR